MSYNYFKKYRKFNKMGFGQASNITKKKKGGLGGGGGGGGQKNHGTLL